MALKNDQSGDPKRVRHWSRPAAGGLGVLLFGLFLSPLWTFAGSGKVIGGTLYVIVVVASLRGFLGGAVFRRRSLLIRGLVWTRRIQWNEIQTISIDSYKQGQTVFIHLTGGKSLPVWGADGSVWFPASAQCKAEELQELRRWVTIARK